MAEHQEYEHQGVMFDTWRNEDEPCVLHVKVRDDALRAKTPYEFGSVEAAPSTSRVGEGAYRMRAKRRDGSKRDLGGAQGGMRVSALNAVCDVLMPPPPAPDMDISCRAIASWFGHKPHQR